MNTEFVLKTWTSRLLVALLVLSLLWGMLPQHATAASPATQPGATPKCGTPYTVKRGDTLAAIGLKFDVTPYTIADGNKMVKPYTIYAGQNLCIPENNKNGSLEGKYANALAAYFTAGFSPNGIYVQPSNYPKNPVWVKGDNAGDKARKFVKIGRLNAKNTANTRVTFTLPTELKNAKTLTVCLKNTLSDYNQCVIIPPR
jgi:LysM repeat protein